MSTKARKARKRDGIKFEKKVNPLARRVPYHFRTDKHYLPGQWLYRWKLAPRTFVPFGF